MKNCSLFYMGAWGCAVSIHKVGWSEGCVARSPTPWCMHSCGTHTHIHSYVHVYTHTRAFEAERSEGLLQGCTPLLLLSVHVAVSCEYSFSHDSQVCAKGQVMSGCCFSCECYAVHVCTSVCLCLCLCVCVCVFVCARMCV